MSSFGDKATPYVAGAGTYYLLVWIFAFFPSFIITLALQRAFFGMEETGESAIFGILSMIGGTFIILGLAKARQWFIVLMLYILTAWPFLYMIHHYCIAGEWHDGVYLEHFPLPLDWWPLW